MALRGWLLAPFPCCLQPHNVPLPPPPALPPLRRYDKASGAQDGTFRDEVAVEKIRQHNDEARRLNAAEEEGGRKAPADGRAPPADGRTATLAGR